MTMPTPPRPLTEAATLDEYAGAPAPRLLPTGRPSGVVPAPVPLASDYTTYLAEGGYPDTAEAAAAFAAGQRQQARLTESRAALHSGVAQTAAMTPAPPGTTPKLPPLPRPTDDDARA